MNTRVTITQVRKQSLCQLPRSLGGSPSHSLSPPPQLRCTEFYVNHFFAFLNTFITPIGILKYSAFVLPLKYVSVQPLKSQVPSHPLAEEVGVLGIAGPGVLLRLGFAGGSGCLGPGCLEQVRLFRASVLGFSMEYPFFLVSLPWTSSMTLPPT